MKRRTVALAKIVSVYGRITSFRLQPFSTIRILQTHSRKQLLFSRPSVYSKISSSSSLSASSRLLCRLYSEAPKAGTNIKVLNFVTFCAIIFSIGLSIYTWMVKLEADREIENREKIIKAQITPELIENEEMPNLVHIEPNGENQFKEYYIYGSISFSVDDIWQTEALIEHIKPDTIVIQWEEDDLVLLKENPFKIMHLLRRYIFRNVAGPNKVSYWCELLNKARAKGIKLELYLINSNKWSKDLEEKGKGSKHVVNIRNLALQKARKKYPESQYPSPYLQEIQKAIQDELKKIDIELWKSIVFDRDTAFTKVIKKAPGQKIFVIATIANIRNIQEYWKYSTL